MVGPMAFNGTERHLQMLQYCCIVAVAEQNINCWPICTTWQATRTPLDLESWGAKSSLLCVGNCFSLRP